MGIFSLFFCNWCPLWVYSLFLCDWCPPGRRRRRAGSCRRSASIGRSRRPWAPRPAGDAGRAMSSAPSPPPPGGAIRRPPAPAARTPPPPVRTQRSDRTPHQAAPRGSRR
eukprot:4254787-Pyramimonas_sp.AAC.1